MADWITTYGGIHFFPLDPEADKIEITDVAHALSLICRGNGHVKTFFSVGQHCIHCALEAEARGYGSRIALACLLHDASEAYMSDVPRPFKQHLSDYISHEKTLLDIVYKSPIVFTSIFNTLTITIVTITAISDGGIFSVILGNIIKIASATTPTISA